MPITRPKSVTEQVNAILRDRIRDKTYGPGCQLPSETHLADEFGVSRSTIRSVLSRLAEEGLLLRKHGDGTYVNQHLQGVNTNLGGLWEFGELIEKNGYTASIEPVLIGSRVANIDECEQFNLPTNSEVLVLKRIFYANRHPEIYVTNIIPRAIIQSSINEIDGKMSLNDILKKSCSKQIAYALSDVKSTLSDKSTAEILKIKKLSPLLKIEIKFYNSDNQLIVIGNSYFNDKTLNLRLIQTWN
jgi:GntR family transcriptional regulator